MSKLLIANNVMAKAFPYLFLLLFFIQGKSFSQKKNVSVRIVQEESLLLDDYETSVTLKKKSFKILVLLEKTDGVYCYASFKDSIYKFAEIDTIPGFSDLPNLAMAEEEFNKEKELLVSNDGWSYWFYNPKLNWHRFNKKLVLLDGGRVVGSKSIRQIYNVSDNTTVKVKDNSKPLYLFFVAVSEVDTKGKPIRELMRRKVKIEWTNDD
jgi:hypothetical protein